MADPATLALVATGAKVGGQAVGALAGFSANKRDAALARRNAEGSRKAAALDGANLTREARKRVGAATARAGASGFTISGSASDVIGQLAAEGAQGASAALFDGLLRGQGFDERANQSESAAKLGLVKGAFDIGGTLLTGAGKSRSLSGGGTNAP